ncbi:platelet-derived growth factor receptor beta-like isoform X2 [Phyllopteryx taeniolatus]|uniref:platelet-derived growth factor receptor beta-like isoform X2 n=1 Tax=Phyllopteryx taeniolatus TaxID=161469 RepID=UPI002AD29C08|nr:platelet-derived growth factor receptor beta-like isoform X2 [Phyllopteryx taeniolatus]
MPASVGGRTASLKPLRFLLGVLLVLPEGGVCLELIPLASQVLLQSHSNFTVVCSGWSEVSWRLPWQESQGGDVVVEKQGSRSVLQLFNVTWRNSGRYACEESSSDQIRKMDIFIPGQGADEWFVPVGPGVVMKDEDEDTIPCAVSDPLLKVKLYERGDETPASGLKYEPSRGFTGRLNDSSYVCVASDGFEETRSQVYYVFSVVVAKEMRVDLTASGGVLKRGQQLLVNCSVQDIDIVYFSWSFPRREEIEPLTEFLPNQIRSFVNIPSATLADSGVYVCAVQETLQGGRVEKNITVNILDRGYISARATHDTNVTSLVGHTAVLRVAVDAHPPPSVVWHKDNRSVVVATGTIGVSSTRVTAGRYVSTLTLARVRLEQTGSYAASVYNEDDRQEVLFYLQVQSPPRITSLTETSTQAVLCVSEGAPPPSVNWLTCHSAHGCTNGTGSWTRRSGASEGAVLQENVTVLADTGVTQVRSVLRLETTTTLTAVRCEASNSAGRRARDLRLVSSSLLSQVATLALVLVLVVIAIVFLLILIILWRKKPRYEVHWKLIGSVSPDGLEYTYLDPAELPYNGSWEIPRDNIVLGEVLGSGAFGRVVEAKVSGLLRDQNTTRVAVKMVKSNSGASQSLLSELKLLCHLGPHVNIVNLLGACTSGGPVYVVTEFCCHGDLANYLRRHKHTFVHGSAHAKREADGGYMDVMSKREGGAVVIGSDSAASDQQEASLPLLSDSTVLGVSDLHSFSFQVAHAMNFLSSRNCVHRDLAARNVLVCEERLVKVGDFDPARDPLKDQDYVARGHALLPLKWMSPESIFQSVYSSQSDVWSYGVLLWEIFSLGESPYSDLPVTHQFYVALKRGHRLTRPQHANSNIYDVMQACWSEHPGSRPPFSSLVASLDATLTDDCRKTYARLTDDFLTGDHPAVVRSRLTSTTVDVPSDTDGSNTSEATVHLLATGPEEAGPSHGEYILPVRVGTGNGGGAALDADRAEESPASQEVTSSREKVEESCV